MFRGAQTGNVDAKGRLKVSALVQRKLKETYESGEVFITSLDGVAVSIFPIKEWEAFEARLADKSTESNQKMDGALRNKILFQTNHFGAENALDNQGRMLIPAVLREAAGMSGEVRMVWQSNHLLVLNATRFEQEAASKSLTAEDFRHAANLGV